jgi:hypothetical protein
MISQKKYPGPYTAGPDGKGLIPACDGAGEIVALGDGVSRWKTGDRVHSIFFEEWLTGPIKVIFRKRYAHQCEIDLSFTSADLVCSNLTRCTCIRLLDSVPVCKIRSYM